MPLFHENLNTAVPQRNGALVLSYPFANEGDLAHVVADRPYYCRAPNYAPPALNSTITVGAATAYLVGDYEHSRGEAGGVDFVRRWASIPANRDDFITLSYQFPGYKFNTGEVLADRGAPRSIAVPCRVTYEYFLCTTGQTYESPEEIPVTERQRYILTFGTQGDSDVDFVLFDGGITEVFTTPDAPDYQDLVTAGTEIVAEDSEIVRYMGDIWCRITKRVVAR